MDLSLLGFEGLREMVNLHPLFVHFPIALLPSALLLYGLGAVLHKPGLHAAGRACLYLGAAGALLAVWTGYMAEESGPHTESVRHLMQTHKTIGLILLGIVAIQVIWSFWHREYKPKAVWGFIGLLLLATLLVLQNADLGGRMVYLEGAAV
jgi:uncharacterized membrane protein